MTTPPPIEATDLGLEHHPGSRHYRAFVGPPGDYDVVGALQFTALFALGMREWHRVADVGCGSLRAGRLIIPYLRPHRYFGIEPEEWLVADGLERELGADVIRAKGPTFAYRDDFQISCFGVEFDYILAQSIFSHTYGDLAHKAITNLAGSLSPSGMLLVTYMDDGSLPGPDEGSGWVYPACVRYGWREFAALLEAAGLESVRLAWPHPRQTWVLAAHRGSVDIKRKAREVRWGLGSSLHHPVLVSLARRMRRRASTVIPSRVIPSRVRTRRHGRTPR
jgi:SAM-dependent methyltransferase